MGACRNLSGCAVNNLPANDDGSSVSVPIGFTINFFGVMYDHLYVNNNGNFTFRTSQSIFTPYGLTGTVTQPIIAAFFADVDTRGAGSGLVTYGNDTIDGHNTFGALSRNVGYFNSQTNKINTFEQYLISRADGAAGDFDIEFDYDQVQWETGTASSGVNGLGGYPVHIGYSNGTGVIDTYEEFSGSGIPGYFLDTNNVTGLIYNSLHSNVAGRYLLSVRNGIPQRIVPVSISQLQGAGDCSGLVQLRWG